MSDDKKLKLRLNLHRVEGLPFVHGKIEVEFRIGTEVHTSKVVDVSTPRWADDPEFKFYGKIDSNERLHIKVRSKLTSGDDEKVGYFDLGSLPKGLTLRDSVVKVRGTDEGYGKVHLSFTAETFGVDVGLFTQAERMSLFVSKIHSRHDKLKNAIISESSGTVNYGLKEAIDKESVGVANLTFMVFPGKFLIYNDRKIKSERGGIVLPQTLQTLFLYGVEGCTVEPFLENEPMFICEGPTKIILHNISFSRESCFLLCKQRGVCVQANFSTIGKIYSEGSSSSSSQSQSEKNEEDTLIFRPIPFMFDKSKTKHIPIGKDKDQTPFSMSSYFVTVIETDYDLNVRSK